MKLYAETSAVLTWLFAESGMNPVADSLDEADVVVTSDLTLIECDRVLIRSATLGEHSEGEILDLRGNLARACDRWAVLGFEASVVERARRQFPVEPIRALDALHLAFALEARGTLRDLEILTLDQRVRENARALGLVVTPDL